ncbi:MAG: branched-chain amino acid ABC transporter permease [Xanthobacteraceae bacterium]|nr:branched-chain amino acid ABC transporter permease [Xanthobacteraceae bacterium]
MENYLYQGLIGLTYSMYLWLLAAGLTIAFGILNILNFSHGSLFMLGAYFAFTLYGVFGINFWLAVLLSALGVALVGAVMERFLFRRIYQLELPFQLLLTYGLVLVLDDIVKIIWGGAFLVPPIPPLLDGAVPLFGRPFPIYNLFILAVGALVGILLWIVFDKTWWGRMARAAAWNREMGATLGMNVPRVFTFVFMFAAALAALGGALGIPMRPVSPGLGIAMIVQAFIVTVIGGLGNLRGAFVGAIVVGMLTAYSTMLFPLFELFLPYVVMAAVLMLRPQGLLGGR